MTKIDLENLPAAERDRVIKEARRKWCSKGGKAGSSADKSRAGKKGIRARDRMKAKEVLRQLGATEDVLAAVDKLEP